jgi:transposase
MSRPAQTGCATCGGTDHRRASSSRCPLRKKRARESSDSDRTTTWDTYTVKRGLRGFMCPLLAEREVETLLAEIRRDVKELSSFSIDFSVLVHFFYTSRMVRLDNDVEFLRQYPRFDGRALAAALSRLDTRKIKCLARLPDPDGLITDWSALCPRRYDAKHRSFSINHIVSQYATVLETNIRTHAFTRIKRAIARMAVDIDRKALHDACYARFYGGASSSGCSPVDEWFDSRIPEPPTAVALERDYWRFVPMFRRLQAETWVSATKSNNDNRNSYCKGRGFRLFPQYHHGLKHLFYDSSALFELLRRTHRDVVPSTWKAFNESPVAGGEAGSRLYWRRYFQCPPNFGYSMQTDSVAVSLTMLRAGDVKKKSMKNTNKKRIKKEDDSHAATQIHVKINPHGYVAVDPGAREPVVTCTDDGAGGFVFKKLTAGRVYYETGEMWREKKRKRITAAVDKEARDEENKMENLEDYSSKHGGDPLAYTRFHHHRFEKIQRVYENRKLARLKFEKYSRRQKFMASAVKEFFPDVYKTVLYGAGCKFMNRATFRGHRKFSHDSLLRELKRSGRTVVLADEAYTTKRCYRCFSGSEVNVSPSPHRYVHCPVCRRGANRDRNGAANILLKATGRWVQEDDNTSQPPFPTITASSREGGTGFLP